MSNAKKALKNGIYGIIGQVILYVVRFIDRKVFLMFLSIELLGYNSLFSDIFNLLSVAELGIGSIIIYNLYKAFATNDNNEISVLVSIYKLVYQFVGIFVLILGIVLSFFLKYVIRDNSFNWSYIYVVYFLILTNTVFSYFLSYKATLYAVAQKDYITVRVNVITNIIFSFIKLVSLIAFKNFIVYLVLSITNSILINLIIYLKSKQDFPHVVDDVKITIDDV